MVKFVLKVGKETCEVEHTAEESFEDFQAKVFTLTDIPPKNQKMLFKAKMLKDNQSVLAVPDGSQLIVMGTKTGKELKQTDIKLETKMEEEEYKIPTRYGLENVGNTCYMNAGIQFLKKVPEFDRALKSAELGNSTTDQMLCKALGRIVKEVDTKDINPKMFVAMFLNSNAEFQPFGTQQDSEEFIQKIMTTVSNSSPENAKMIRQNFQIEFKDTMKNIELEQQPAQYSFHTSQKLCCSLGGLQVKINTLVEGIKHSLATELEKKSPIDDVNHLYRKISQFSVLPKYLMVQMIRFFWKKADDLPFAKPTAAKICKSIEFSATLDVFDFCTDELKKQLEKGRQAYEEHKKQEEVRYKEQYQKYKKSLGDTNRPETRAQEEFEGLWKRKLKTPTQGLETGMYEICAVVTHLGNSVESGHYMAWTKEDEENWTKYDDDTVYQQPTEKVFQLRGGQPNLEIAYVLMFRKIYTPL